VRVVFTFFKRLLRFALIMGVTVAALAVAVVLIAPQAGHLASAHRSDHERINLDPLAERSLIFDRNGSLLATLHLDQNRSQVPLSDVPKTVTGSIIAVEDANFYRHKGVNLRSIVRAAGSNIDTGRASQGGSTITQQLVKNGLVGNKRNFSRKIREAVLAVELEKQMTKDEILERYLNTVYFGNGAYGVQAAAEVYFNKSVGKLNWAEGALLASLIRSPNQYDPFRRRTLALRRRDLGFRRLIETHRLTRAEVSFYRQVPLPRSANQPRRVDDYFVDEVKQRLLDDPRFGLGATQSARYHSVFQGGLRIHTTFDPVAQLFALGARNQTMLTVPGSTGNGTFPLPGIDTKTGKPNFGTEAIVSIEPSTGAVRVMVGGPGFNRYKYNLATSNQQPGSSMKAFVLAALFENGYVPDDQVSGDSCKFKIPGQPLYAVEGKAGTDTITGQTKRSANCAFIRLGQIVGTRKVIDLARLMGITTPLAEGSLNPDLFVSLPLGTAVVKPFDMASAYSVFANDGMRNEPYFIDRIEDRHGKVLYQHRLSPVRVLQPQTARLVTQVLTANVEGGTGTRAKITTGQPAAGKTGTTQLATDVWFVGYTPQLATAIWMGGAGNTDISLTFPGIGGATGGKFPALTWGVYMNSLLARVPIIPFIDPDATRPGQDLRALNEVEPPSPAPTQPGPPLTLPGPPQTLFPPLVITPPTTVAPVATAPPLTAPPTIIITTPPATFLQPATTAPPATVLPPPTAPPGAPGTAPAGAPGPPGTPVPPPTTAAGP